MPTNILQLLYTLHYPKMTATQYTLHQSKLTTSTLFDLLQGCLVRNHSGRKTLLFVLLHGLLIDNVRGPKGPFEFGIVIPILQKVSMS